MTKTGFSVVADYDVYLTLGSVLATQLVSQTGCSAERSLLLNYPPYTTEITPISINPGVSIMIGVFANNPLDAVSITDEYDITIVDGFDDYDSNLPLSVVEDSWSYGGFYPGEDI